MNKKQFLNLGKKRGYIGLPCDNFFEDTSDLKLEFDGPIGDVVARCYWSDTNGNGGCVSVPTLNLVKAHFPSNRDAPFLFKGIKVCLE